MPVGPRCLRWKLVRLSRPLAWEFFDLSMADATCSTPIVVGLLSERVFSCRLRSRKVYEDWWIDTLLNCLLKCSAIDKFLVWTALLKFIATLVGWTDLPFSDGIEEIAKEIFRLQDLLVDKLSNDRYMPIVYPKENRSGILSVICKQHHPGAIVLALLDEKIICIC